MWSLTNSGAITAQAHSLNAPLSSSADRSGQVRVFAPPSAHVASHIPRSIGQATPRGVRASHAAEDLQPHGNSLRAMAIKSVCNELGSVFTTRTVSQDADHDRTARALNGSARCGVGASAGASRCTFRLVIGEPILGLRLAKH